MNQAIFWNLGFESGLRLQKSRKRRCETQMLRCNLRDDESFYWTAMGINDLHLQRMKLSVRRPFQTASSLLFVRDTLLTSPARMCQVKKGTTEDRKGRFNLLLRNDLHTRMLLSLLRASRWLHRASMKFYSYSHVHDSASFYTTFYVQLKL